jgi:hypothetical protein
MLSIPEWSPLDVVATAHAQWVRIVLGLLWAGLAMAGALALGAWLEMEAPCPEKQAEFPKRRIRDYHRGKMAPIIGVQDGMNGRCC